MIGWQHDGSQIKQNSRAAVRTMLSAIREPPHPPTEAKNLEWSEGRVDDHTQKRHVSNNAKITRGYKSKYYDCTEKSHLVLPGRRHIITSSDLLDFQSFLLFRSVIANFRNIEGHFLFLVRHLRWSRHDVLVEGLLLEGLSLGGIFRLFVSQWMFPFVGLLSYQSFGEWWKLWIRAPINNLWNESDEE